MKKIILILLLSNLCYSQTSSDPKWMTELSQMTEKNKAEHYWTSFIGTMALSWCTYEITDRAGLSCWVGGVLMYGIGELKEDVWDGIMKKGVKSGGDKFMNGMGCSGGMIGGRVLINEYEKKYCYSVDYFDSQLTYKKRRK